ncbi:MULTISPECIES: sensor histidine kinase [unclassified Streptomyces]|uniref:sensor histidine kinase n=1 Tax=unclassified Streptomyces TaxID=2593676 RepID=UPI00224ED61D|nr:MULTISPECIES: histidine kinase [unclassified Streptomyces]MCX5141941.1 histidine kinase [Streptomyces sp. NBC_00338]WRZ66415.1 histidine kinase [Streptomyces sp. NBC_01257]WSU60409.1 histidine kinase [Streptomyces sp. NBC_01104]
MAVLSYLVIIALNIFATDLQVGVKALAVAVLAAVFVIQLVHSAPDANRAPAARKCLTLGTQALLTYLPVLFFGAQWGSMAGFLAGSLLLMLPTRAGWTLYGLVGVSMFLAPFLKGYPLVDTFYSGQSTLLTGLVVYGLSRLAELIQELHSARDEVARMAVTQERLRFARDLHDLLGYSLSAITLKSELIHRLIPKQPDRAMAEVEDVLSISRQSLADVRRVASGFRDMSLTQEIEIAESVLIAARVDVEVRVAISDISQRIENVLAAVLREAVTNVLRHSEAQRCVIEASQGADRVRLSVLNDGTDPGHRDPSPHSGSGLGNLQLRLSEVGGSLVSGQKNNGGFQVRAEAPTA